MTYKVYQSYAEFDADYEFTAKAGFTLTPLQIEDIETFVRWDRSLNLYEVGGGKSVVSSVVALMRGNRQKIVMVPPILVTPWATWLNKVSDGVLVYRGTPVERKKMNVKKAHWIVLSHGIFRLDYDRLSADLSEDLEIIVDECHALKNVSSVLFKKVQRLCQGL